MSNLGRRGGSTVSLRHAQSLFAKWKKEEMGWLKARIVWIAHARGEFHGDDLEDVKLSERSIIGAVVNALVRSDLLVSTGEHRRSRTEAGHGRRSYVYRLTKKGEAVARAIEQTPRDRLPQRPDDVPKPPTLFGGEGAVVVEVDEIDVASTRRSAPRPVPLDGEFWRSIERANELRSADAAARREREREERVSQQLSWDAE